MLEGIKMYKLLAKVVFYCCALQPKAKIVEIDETKPLTEQGDAPDEGK